jgi:hypothetical protein
MPPTAADGSSATPGASRALVHRLRTALISALTEGSWRDIEDDHKKVGLTWCPDLEPYWGKPRYLERVLDELPDADVVALARRCLERFPNRCAFAVEDALLWLDAGGVASVSELTRLRLAELFDGRRLHPNEPVGNVLLRFAKSRENRRYEYGPDGGIWLASVRS